NLASTPTHKISSLKALLTIGCATTRTFPVNGPAGPRSVSNISVTLAIIPRGAPGDVVMSTLIEQPPGGIGPGASNVMVVPPAGATTVPQPELILGMVAISRPAGKLSTKSTFKFAGTGLGLLI